MSIPKRDPSFTMTDLNEAAGRFLAAGQEYWEACRKAGLDIGSVTWIEDSAKGLAIFTRGEYRDTIMRNIPDVGRTYSLGGTMRDQQS
jgi:hypothetical protein